MRRKPAVTGNKALLVRVVKAALVFRSLLNITSVVIDPAGPGPLKGPFSVLTILTDSSFNTSDDLLDLMDSIALNSSSSTESSPICPTDDATTATGRVLRNKRSRSNSLEENMHKVKRRTISKPRKLNPATLAADVSEHLIKKLYTNKKMTKLKPTNLETIFEEPKPGKNETVTYVSATRFKRSISFTDHYNVPKQTVQNRRKRVKRLLGSHKLKKMSMDAFMERFELLQEKPIETEETERTSS